MAKNKNRNRSQGGGNAGTSSNEGQRAPFPPCKSCKKTNHDSAKCYYFKCNRNGCPGRAGEHTPQTCPLAKGTNTAQVPYNNAQVPYNNAQVPYNSANQQKYCTHCSMYGHEWSNCRARDSKRPTDVSMTSPIAPPQLYCEYCNLTAHSTVACSNTVAIIAWHTSRLKCHRCGKKGHTNDSCKNPARKDCDFCLAPGHDKAHCPFRQNKSKQECKTPTTAVRRTFRRDSKVLPSQFKVDSNYVIHPSQARRRYLEESKFEYLQRVVGLSEDDKLRFELQLADLERETLDAERNIFELRSPASASWRRLQHVSESVPTHSTRNVSQARRSTRATSLAAHHGRDAAWAEQAMREKELRDIDEAELKIIEKINSSRSLYTAEEYSQKIRLHESSILNTLQHVMDRSRFDRVKHELLMQGIKIYRDPQAIAALFGRRIPVCIRCGHEGVIVDRVFECIDPMLGSDRIYDIDDSSFADWGIFIVFDKCDHRMRSPYRFDKIPKYITDNFDMTDRLYKPYGDLA